ncbi:fructose-bisphosphate aldolase class II [Halanaerobium saccharolyticum]|uniref:Fructose-bisphosphate aldolase class II n=1 Tax=Halanaerobium saccharolyticum TaxID=43595 RepID=A0A4R7Z9J3_9FIRM|nr:ketose-bisphosphate aldolase [Halanaerobium saccharolyticum]RAK12576.1 fructose-bisphosphate aldolase class II [Halanaerobium saccharolyticum]TDW06502.1 fructose-bisphosphate aldolase class II [Halanaerobium saccharolyticum]TDX61750.1 fructose-bisphosphate aldolase class II [Halanaerobium saccharolyticum]
MLMNMKDLLKVANEHNFAVPAFNISDYAMLNGIFEAVEEKQAPVIIAIHPDELSHTKPEIVKAITEKANKTKVPVCIHLDHGSSLAQIMLAIKSGFTSVMIDGSSLPLEENIAICQEIVKVAHSVDISVEGELGTIGSTDAEAEAGENEIIYTDPDVAKRFVKETGIDTLAVAIGTSHGIYPEGMEPELQLELLKEIKSKVDIPLVLHGGSSNPDQEICRSVELGINKINISSDIKAAYYKKMREVLKDGSLREPNTIQPPCIKAMKEIAFHKIELFNTDDKARLY